jgi:hypothetical protein
LASETALALVSDHGSNSDERVYSQGYNLVKLLGSAAGGGHHVITKRRLLLDYSIKGVYPLVPLITTTTEESYYLAKQSADYPTALLDFDGNERASIHLRDSDLNLLHILLQQLARKGLDPATRRSATDALFATINRRRAEWTGEAAQLKEELGALQRQIEKLEPIVQALPKKWSEEDRNTGRDKEAARVAVRLEMLKEDVRAYGEYLRTLDRLLALRREAFDPLRLKIEDLIPRRSMGWPNTIHQLQNYVVGLAPGGLALAPDGSLDMARSFIRLNYFSLLRGVKVRNNVQPGIDSHPVDFVAVRVPRESLVAALDRETMPDEDAIWLYGGDDRQALILARRDAAGQLWLRYLPVAQLKQDASGQVTFNRSEWRADLPLKLWEAQQLKTDGDRRGWLDGWHTELEWLRATHLTEYSNAIIGLHEQLARHEIGALALDQPGLSADERLLRRFRWRQRRLVEADLLILANNHWNFDVRGFNPGGNHGSFFRVSTHSTLLFAGGSATGIPRGRTVEEPYDSLSFIPTVLKLIGQLPDGKPSPELLERGFQPFPGRVIEELFDSPAAGDPVSDAGAAKSPQ